MGALALSSDRYHEYLLGVPCADAVLNPVNVLWSPVEISYSLVESQTCALLVDDMFASMVPPLRAAHPQLATVIFIGEGPVSEGCSTTRS